MQLVTDSSPYVPDISLFVFEIIARVNFNLRAQALVYSPSLLRNTKSCLPVSLYVFFKHIHPSPCAALTLVQLLQPCHVVSSCHVGGTFR